MSSPSGLVVMSQQVSTLESASFGFDDGAGVMGDQPAQHGVGMLCVAQVPGAIELVQAREGKARRRSRCRAAMRRLPADGRQRRGLVPGRVPFTDVACHCAYGAGASGARSHKGV